MHRFTGIEPEVYFYVVENKSYAGKEEVRNKQAKTRPVIVAFSKRAGPDVDPIVVEPVSSAATGAIELKSYTPAELLRAAGLHLPLHDNATDKQEETAYEDVFLAHGLVCNTTRAGLSANPHGLSK